MKVILTKDVDSLGFEGTIVEVKDGYARNYLLPKSLAIIASAGNLKIWENEKKARERRIAQDTDKAKKQAEILAQKKLTISAKVGEEGKLYGSVTAQDIADAVMNQIKIEIDRKKIIMDDVIKTAGEHTVSVRVYKDVKAVISLEIVAEA